VIVNLRRAILAVLLISVLPAAQVEAQQTYFPIPLVNWGAEDGEASPDGMTSVDVLGWTVTGSLTIVAYGTPGPFPSIGPGLTGQFFAGGSSLGLSSANQIAQIPQQHWECIDEGFGLCSISASALLGGWSTDADSTRLLVTVLDGQSNDLSMFVVSPSYIPGGHTGSYAQVCSEIREIPPGARAVNVRLEMYGVEGSYNNGWADDIQAGISYNVPTIPTTWGSIKVKEISTGITTVGG
jgi:hypothetical protein